jgi:putative ABC transport system permease protein
MTWLRVFTSRFLALFHRRRFDQRADEEVRFHLEMEIEENLRRGMSLEEAQRAARMKFGNVTLAKEDSREAWGFGWLDRLWQDVRYGVRMLAKSPGFTAVAVLSLALGIGATTAIFSIFDTVFLRPLPFPKPDRLVGLWETETDKPDSRWSVSEETFRDWREQSRSFEELALTNPNMPFAVTGVEQSEQLDGRYVTEGYFEILGGRTCHGQSEQLDGRYVTEGYFEILGGRTCHGRLFTPEDHEETSDSVVILSYGTWQRVFGSDPSVVGRAMNLGGKPRVVVGVMSPEYRSLWGDKIDLWANINTQGHNRKGRYFPVIGRLKPGTDIEKAQAELDVIAAGLAARYPEQKGFGVRVEPLQEYLYGRFRNRLLVFFVAVVFVLLIACANVANLLLMRAAAREKEIAVRASLGAGRPRLIRQLLTESTMLSCMGAGLGLLFAYGVVQVLINVSPEYAIPRANEIAINERILGFTVTIAILTGCLSGLFPALGKSKPDLNESLKEAGRSPTTRPGGQRIQTELVVAQVALSLVLLIGAGLMVHSVWRVLHTNVGFKTDNVVQMSVQLPRFGYFGFASGQDVRGRKRRMKPEGALAIEGIRERLKALPGVTAIGVTNWGVLQGCASRLVSAGSEPLPRVRSGEKVPWACYQPVSPGYFRMLEIPLLKGRVFSEWDSKNSPGVAVISESLAQRYFAGEDPVGKMINLGRWDFKEVDRREVVGVVADARQLVHREPLPALYLPFSQMAEEFFGPQLREHSLVSFVVRAGIDPASLAPAMRRAASEVARDIPVLRIQTVDDIRLQSTRWSRFYAWLLAAFAVTALVLAVVGVSGVTSYAVTQRTHEIGVRMALGARPADIVRLIMRRGIVMTVIGVAIGVGGAFGLTRFLESQLSEVEPTDPLTFTTVSVLLGLTALLACFLPARRAARVNPMNALRHE